MEFIIRDFKTSDEYQLGAQGGEKYLNEFLKGNDNLDKEKKEMREVLVDCFEEINCFLLPHPGLKVAERGSFRGLVKDIKPAFRDEVKYMVNTLLNPTTLKPKVVNGKEITCRRFGEIVRVSRGIKRLIPSSNL